MPSNYVSVPAQVIDSKQYVRHDDGLASVPYYTAPGLQNLSTFAWQNKDLRAIPFVLGGGAQQKIIEMGINIAGAAVSGSKARLAIYADDGNVRPGCLIKDVGEVSISSLGFKSITNLNIPIAPGLYWLCLWLTMPSGTVTTSVLTPATGLYNFLGYDVVNLAGYSHYYANLPYSTYPSNWPTSTLAKGGLPAIFIKFGA